MQTVPLWQRYWWAPLAAIAAAIALGALLNREQPLRLDTLPAEVVATGAAIDAQHGARLPAPRALRLRWQRTTTLEGHGSTVDVRSTITPLGQGWVLRADEWTQPGAGSAFYQERALLHRNLYAAQSRWRDLAPFVHDLFGEFGWQGMRSQRDELMEAHSNGAAGFQRLKLRQRRVDEGPDHQRREPYSRETDCESGGTIAGQTVGLADAGPLPVLVCTRRDSDGRVASQTSHVLLPGAGVYVAFRGQTEHHIGETLRATETYEQKLVEMKIDAP